MVSEIQADDEEMMDQLLKQGFLPLNTPVEKIGKEKYIHFTSPNFWVLLTWLDLLCLFFFYYMQMHLNFTAVYYTMGYILCQYLDDFIQRIFNLGHIFCCK